MTELEKRLREDRQVRNAAKGNFEAGLTQVKTDLGARGIAGRMTDSAKQKAGGALATGFDIASESKGIIAAVAAGIGLWTFRAPLLRRIAAWRAPAGQAEVQSAKAMSAADDEPDSGVNAQ